MFYALIGIPTLKLLAGYGVQWAAKYLADKVTGEEPKQSDDNFTNNITKDV